MFMPFQVLGFWFRGLLAVVVLGAGIYLLSQWFRNREHEVTETVFVAPNENTEMREPADEEPVQREHSRVVRWEFGLNRETAFLLGGLSLLAWSLGGGWLLNPRLLRRPGTDEPAPTPARKVQRLLRPDGTELQIEFHGLAEGDPIVLVHGWALDSAEWCYSKRELGGQYPLIAWDLPGLGASTRPVDRDWSLEKLARHLDAVVTAAGGRPVTLLGHSIGTMIILTYCRLFPEVLGTRVRALVLAQSTYTNPVRTASMATLYTALQKPLLEPLCHMMIWLAPFVWALNWLTYLNGSAHRSTERGSFSGHESRGQLDFLTRYYCKAPPDVLGRGMLAMFRYDATDVLRRIKIPTLVVAGDQDVTCSPDASRFIAESIAGAKLVVLPNARHCGLFEFHGRFHMAVSDFLSSIHEAATIPTGLPEPVVADRG